MAQLLFCEAFIAMKGLKEGGNFVIKTFTTLECQTVCLLYLLCACFREVRGKPLVRGREFVTYEDTVLLFSFSYY